MGSSPAAPLPGGTVPGVDVAALARWLPAVLDDYDPGSELRARLLTGGRSNLTCLLSQPGRAQGTGRQWVLRRPPLGHVLPTAHDMAREFRALSSLAADYDVTFVHGDYRLDNLVVDPETEQVRAVLDWEMSTQGDPLMDLALLLVYWEEPGDGLRREIGVARNLTTADGFWSRDQLVGAYAEATRRPLDHLDVCLGLACLKLAAVMESIHYRYLAGQALDPLSAGLGDAAPALLELGLAVAGGQGLAGLAA